jgi:hypothetical protein
MMRLALAACLLRGGAGVPVASGGSCESALAAVCGASGTRTACDACAGQHQRELRGAGCTPEQIRSWCDSPAGDSLVLEKAVILSRHGIRTPYPSGFIGQPSYDVFSKDGRQWPSVGNGSASNPPDAAWGVDVAAGLTAHGGQVLQRHGEFYRGETWARIGGVGTAAACDQLTVYADPDASTHRDYQTAKHFMSGLLPQCPDLQIQRGAELEPIFNQGDPSHYLHKVTPKGCPGMPDETLIGASLLHGHCRRAYHSAAVAAISHTNRRIALPWHV